MSETFHISRKIMGNVKKGRRPYIQISGVRYGGELLRKQTNLVGRIVILTIQANDLRKVGARLENGPEIGELDMLVRRH